MDQDSVDRMCDQILEEAKSEAKSMVEKAKTSVNQRVALTKQQVQSNVNKQMRQAQDDAAKLRKKITSTLNLEKRKLLLRKREEFIQELLDKVADKLVDFTSSKEYLKYLKKSLLDAVQELGTKDIHVQIGKNDPLADIRKIFIEVEKQCAENGKPVSLHLDKTQHSLCGLIVSNLDGNIRVNATLQERLQSQMDDIRVYLVKRLFGENDNDR